MNVLEQMAAQEMKAEYEAAVLEPDDSADIMLDMLEDDDEEDI